MTLDLSEFEALTKQREPCKVGVTLGSLDDEAAAKFGAAVGRYNLRVVADWLRLHHGYEGTWQALRTHMKGECGCDD